MAIEGVKNVQATVYQASQAVTKPTEQVNVETPDAVVDTPVQVAKAGKDEDSGTGYDTQRREAPNEQIKKAISDINKRMSNTSCQFGVHEGTGRVTIKIIDKDTKDVIKEFPAEKTLEMIEKAWELAGIMVDEKR